MQFDIAVRAAIGDICKGQCAGTGPANICPHEVLGGLFLPYRQARNAAASLAGIGIGVKQVRTDCDCNMLEDCILAAALFVEEGKQGGAQISHEVYYSKPFKDGRGPQLVAAMHDNSKGDPSFSMFFKYDSEGTQSGFADPKVDDLIARANAAVGDERAKLWSELIAYVHDEVVADVLLFHMLRSTFQPLIRRPKTRTGEENMRGPPPASRTHSS